MYSDILSCSQKLVDFVVLLFLDVFYLGSLWGGILFCLRGGFFVYSGFFVVVCWGFSYQGTMKKYLPQRYWNFF